VIGKRTHTHHANSKKTKTPSRHRRSYDLGAIIVAQCTLSHRRAMPQLPSRRYTRPATSSIASGLNTWAGASPDATAIWSTVTLPRPGSAS